MTGFIAAPIVFFVKNMREIMFRKFSLVYDSSHKVSVFITSTFACIKQLI